ncbi:MAG: hypothetical protein M3N38_11950 [Pseudomonadota bacterium]|nr:hypothetical protein [Pseudomonadota bacterium]
MLLPSFLWLKISPRIDSAISSGPMAPMSPALRLAPPQAALDALGNSAMYEEFDGGHDPIDFRLDGSLPSSGGLCAGARED